MPFKNGKVSKTRIASLVGQAILCLFILFACGGDAGFDTGSVSFSLQWEDPVPAASVARYAAATSGFDVCSDYGLDTIHAAIYNAANSLIAQESWPCSAHEGIIHNLPAGANMRLELQGKINGHVRWSGEKPNITVTVGQNTNTGTVTMDYTGGDNTRPAIISKTPSHTAVDVSVNANITAIFSEKMASSSINDSTFILKKGITSVSGSVTYNASTNTAIFNPSGSLSYITTHTATITTSAEDMATNHMLNNYTWSFTTVDGHCSTPGTPSNPNPSDYEDDVSIDADLDWPVCVNADSYDVYFGTSSNPPYHGNTTFSGYSLSPLSYYAHYYWKIIAKNDCGNSTSGPVWDFTTEDEPIANTLTVPSINYQMVYIAPGTFIMGSPISEAQRHSDETQHQVTLTRGFYLGATEVTHGQWWAIMGNNPSRFDSCGVGCPVEYVSWEDCQEFIGKLNQLAGTDKYRLPTEAEWEYACRAGTETPFYFGVCLSTDQANYKGNYPYPGCAGGVERSTPLPVKSFSANARGLYDMHGNVYEWCQEWYGSYPSGAVSDPVGPSSGSERVVRGGGWESGAGNCRSADRSDDGPGLRYFGLGFRLARTLDDEAPTAPTNVSAIDGEQQVTITWDNVSGATAYNIYWAEAQGVTKGNGTKIPDATNPYIHTGRTNGVIYYYVLTAENYYDESATSREVNATPVFNGLFNSAWPCKGRNARHTGRSPFLGAQTNTLKWSYETGYWVESSPVIGGGGTIYIGSSDDKIYAINPDGTLKWSYLTGGNIASSPAIGADGTIYIGSRDSNLYAINPNGTLKWSYYINSATYSGNFAPILGTDGTVYVSSNTGTIYAINSKDGNMKWSYCTLSPTYSEIGSPAIGADGTLYIGGNHLYAINPDGTLKWKYSAVGGIASSPAIGADGTIYFGSYDRKVYALNTDGTLKWSYVTGDEILSSPAIDANGTIYIGSEDNKLYAINSDGKLKWIYQTGGDINSTPAIGADGTIYFGSYDRKVYALNTDGTLKWSYQTGEKVISSPAIGADGTVYIGSWDNNLYAFGL